MYLTKGRLYKMKKRVPKINTRISTGFNAIVGLDYLFYLCIHEVVKRIQVLLDQTSYLQPDGSTL